MIPGWIGVRRQWVINSRSKTQQPHGTPERMTMADSPKTIAMYLPIEPKPQRRVRFTRFGKFSKTYKDDKQKDAEEFIGFYLEKYVPEKPYECPLILSVVADFRMPKSKSAWWKEAAEVDIIKHTKTPDLDNLVKFLADVMQTMGFYLNDNQIISIQAKKQYALDHGWHIHLIPQSEPKSKKEYDKLTLNEFEVK